MIISIIQEDWFYSNQKEKTKINWFLYETALEFELYFNECKDLAKFRKTHGTEGVAKFSAYYAKRMKQSLYEQFDGWSDAVIFHEEYITDYFPKIPLRQVKMLLKVSMEAWDNLLSRCVVCPVRCLSEREKLSDLFGRYDF